MNLGVSTYSFWHFGDEKKPLQYYLERAYAHGFNGVEILENTLGDVSRSYLRDVKSKAFSLGLDIYCLSIHNNFVSPSRESRQEEVEKVSRWLEVAHYLGAKVIRVNSGRWRTLQSFDELMKARGIEPPLPGYTEEDALGWVVESLNTLVPKAEDLGVILGLENHWGVSRTAENMVRIFNSVNSRYLRAVMDTGNFLERTYEQFELIAPYTAMVQAKTYFGGGVWYTFSLDYDRIFETLRRAGFKGWISLEFEGREDYESGVKKSFDLLSKYLGWR